MTAIILSSLLAAASTAAASVPAQTDPLPATLKAEYIERVDSADYYLRAEMYADAERCLLDALRIDPANFNNSLLLSNLGMAYAYRGQHDKAIDSFTTGLGFAPSNTTLLSNRCRVYLQTGRPADAMADLNSILAIDPDHAWARKMRAFIEYGEGRLQPALDDILTLSDPDPDAIRVAAYIYSALDNDAKALEWFDRLIAASPTDESYADRAAYLVLTGRENEAADDVREGLKLNLRNGDLYAIRAKIHRNLHQNREAEIDKKMANDYGADSQLIQRLFPEDAKKNRK